MLLGTAEGTTEMQHSVGLRDLPRATKAHLKGLILYDSVYIIFSKWQNYVLEEPVNGCQVRV